MNLSDDFKPDIILVEIFRLGLEIMNEILHQRVDFILGPVPVLDRKRVEGEILDADLARRANEQVRVRHPRGVKVIRNHLLRNIPRLHLARLHLRRDCPHRIGDLRPAPVIQRQY